MTSTYFYWLFVLANRSLTHASLYIFISFFTCSLDKYICIIIGFFLRLTRYKLVITKLICFCINCFWTDVVVITGSNFFIRKKSWMHESLMYKIVSFAPSQICFIYEFYLITGYSQHSIFLRIITFNKIKKLASWRFNYYY